jgi:adenosylmethionine-8-amino-7-oxononanoate aminotransferase
MLTADRRAEIIRLDKRRVWHPWTPMKQYIDTVEPLVIARAQGSRLYDADGRSYIDGISSWWVTSLGHQHVRLLAALERQSRNLCHTSLDGIAHEAAAELAALLCAAAPPGLERVFYSDNGSTAVEVAMKIAFQFWRNEGLPRKTRFVALDHAFHGETLGAASLSGLDVFAHGYAGLLIDCIRAPVPRGEDDCEAAVRALATLFADHGEEIAALAVEPLVQGGGGMRFYPAAYLREARRLCDEHDVLLLADEVFTGYGRTGSMWSTAGAGIAPDIMCLSKAFSGGMLPMAATLTTERIFRAFYGGVEQAFMYGHSYCGNPLGAAVAAEVLRIYRDESIIERARPKTERLAQAFVRIGSIPGAMRARSLGMIGAVDLPGDPDGCGRTGWRVATLAQTRGVVIRPLGDTVYIVPPLTIPDEDLDELAIVLEDCIATVLA